jgi:hypothetical protein
MQSEKLEYFDVASGTWRDIGRMLIARIVLHSRSGSLRNGNVRGSKDMLHAGSQDTSQAEANSGICW